MKYICKLYKDFPIKHSGEVLSDTPDLAAKAYAEGLWYTMSDNPVVAKWARLLVSVIGEKDQLGLVFAVSENAVEPYVKIYDDKGNSGIVVRRVS